MCLFKKNFNNKILKIMKDLTKKTDLVCNIVVKNMQYLDVFIEILKESME